MIVRKINFSPFSDATKRRISATKRKLIRASLQLINTKTFSDSSFPFACFAPLSLPPLQATDLIDLAALFNFHPNKMFVSLPLREISSRQSQENGPPYTGARETESAGRHVACSTSKRKVKRKRAEEREGQSKRE